jgi:hypothetical protein
MSFGSPWMNEGAPDELWVEAANGGERQMSFGSRPLKRWDTR